MSRLVSMEPVGILNACTMNVRMKVARMNATTRDSRYSRATDFLCVVVEGGAVSGTGKDADAMNGHFSRETVPRAHGDGRAAAKSSARMVKSARNIARARLGGSAARPSRCP